MTTTRPAGAAIKREFDDRFALAREAHSKPEAAGPGGYTHWLMGRVDVPVAHEAHEQTSSIAARAPQQNLADNCDLASTMAMVTLIAQHLARKRHYGPWDGPWDVSGGQPEAIARAALAALLRHPSDDCSREPAVVRALTVLVDDLLPALGQLWQREVTRYLAPAIAPRKATESSRC